MKKLMTMSFIILFSVLTILSYINYAYDAVEQIEYDKQTLVIEKPNDVTNEKFLSDIDEALAEIDQDIMYRFVDVTGNKPEYSYFKTNHTDDFISSPSTKEKFQIEDTECISTFEEIEGYKKYDLKVSDVFQDITFYSWYKAGIYDLSSCTYYVSEKASGKIASIISELGYEVTSDIRIFASGKLPVLVFAFIPGVLLILSILFYTLSNGKKNVIKKMEGYTYKSIFVDEIKFCGSSFLTSFLIIEVISLVVSGFLFFNAWLEYWGYAIKYLVGGFFVFFIGWCFSLFIICLQNKAEYVKGKVPKKGIYYLSMLAKCIFVTFIAFFMSIAIRNISVCYNTFQTSRFIADKIDNYVTIPINENNASSVGLEENYLSFYKDTVDKYDGIIIDSSNYQYDITTGTTLCEQYGQDYIIVNNNYLSFNPIYDLNKKQILEDSLDKEKLNVLLPESKKDKSEQYAEYVKNAYSVEANFILYDTTSKIYSYNADSGIGTYGEIKEPVIMIVPDNLYKGIFILSYCSKGEYFVKIEEDPYEELLPILERNEIHKVTPQTPYIASNFDSVLEHQFQMLILYGSQTFILTIGLICLIIFSSKLYCENYRERLVISFCEGFSIGRCMAGHFVLMILLYLVSMIAIYFCGIIINVAVNMYLPVLAMLLDLICTSFLGKNYTKRNLCEIMKGAE